MALRTKPIDPAGYMIARDGSIITTHKPSQTMYNPHLRQTPMTPQNDLNNALFESAMKRRTQTVRAPEKRQQGMNQSSNSRALTCTGPTYRKK